MNSGSDCDRVRLQLMAALDRETVEDVRGSDTDTDRHLASCSSCRGWLNDLESINTQFQSVAYPRLQVDLWAAVEGRIHESNMAAPVIQRLWLIGVVVLVWRALQLLIDLPFPVWHPIVPLAAAIAALWQVSRDPLAIETFAPELQKGRV